MYLEDIYMSIEYMMFRGYLCVVWSLSHISTLMANKIMGILWIVRSRRFNATEVYKRVNAAENQILRMTRLYYWCTWSGLAVQVGSFTNIWSTTWGSQPIIELKIPTDCWLKCERTCWKFPITWQSNIAFKLIYNM